MADFVLQAARPDTRVADKLRGFPGRTVLLTHHQPFSAFAQVRPLSAHRPVNPNLMARYRRLAAAGRVDAWFWGHEHRLRRYAPYRGLPAGRNVGVLAIHRAGRIEAASWALARPEGPLCPEVLGAP